LSTNFYISISEQIDLAKYKLVNFGIGEMENAHPAFIPVHTKADIGNRISVPRHFSEHLPWLNGSRPIRAWLVLLSPGRIRLLSEEQVRSDPQLEPICELLLEGTPAAICEPSSEKPLQRAAVVARLVPVSIAPPATSGPGWRISFPKVFDEFIPPDCKPNAFSILLSIEGYLEIWYTEVLRRAVLVPWPAE
jgi:hypothetical protein